MSRKGFTKAVYRLPHTLSTKTGIRDGTDSIRLFIEAFTSRERTRDDEFTELNNKFTTCEKITANLLQEVMKYRDNVTSMLNHQAEFGIVLAEIYDPNLSMSGGEVTPRRAPTAPESIQAVDDFQAVMRETRDILLPEVDKLEMTVVRPLTEMQNNMKLIRKTMTKREHKLVDYDRYRISLKKLNDKKERTLNDEKQIYKLESQLEVATADYEGLNGLLREELPGFFYYNIKLMEPIFNTFYYLQLNIYNIMLQRITPLANSGYYDLTMNVLQGYEARKQDTAPTVESVELITRKSVTASYQSKYGRPSLEEGAEEYQGVPAQAPNAHRGYSPIAPTPGTKSWEAGVASAGAKPWQTGGSAAPPAMPAPGLKPWQTGGSAVSASAAAPGAKPWQTGAASSAPPPAYNAQSAPAAEQSESRYGGPSNVNIHLTPSISGTIAATAAAAATSHAMNSFSATLNQMQAQAAAKKGPPPPIPKRIGVPGGAKMAVALYDYDAQQAGDLSFRKDDHIEIVERSNNPNEWWTGKLNGKQGIFPGTYVQEL
ncbi:hypothetical protein BGZ95_007616 [Linnemannia exigua]|uniref:BAR-domain-containing protein n=1 Tax=Linnemannia exigua TaxID=604196 RepID=A0AAD4DF97_9FUNG|nr:hypothetical protein BGZ95_007616 [Linnemannia exigua]